MDYAAIVDQLGDLKARIAALTEEERVLKKAIADSGYAELDGNLFRATVSLSERGTLDAEKVREILSEDQVRHCTKVTEITTVRVVARKRAAA